MPRARRRPRTRRPFTKRRRNTIRMYRRKAGGIGRDMSKFFVHRFKRQTVLFGQGGTINTTIATPTGIAGGYASIGFNNYLTQASQYAEFTALYDYYKINYIVYKIVWLGTTLSGIEVANTSTGAPHLYYVLDRDDVTPYAASDAGLQDMRANGMCRRHVFTPDRRECTIKLKPNLLSENFNGALSTAYTIMFNKWIDCNNDAVPHYGTKLMFHTPSPNSQPSVANYFEITATYYLSFKQPR